MVTAQLISQRLGKHELRLSRRRGLCSLTASESMAGDDSVMEPTEDRLRKIEERHQPTGELVCNFCAAWWPCESGELLQAVRALRQERRRLLLLIAWEEQRRLLSLFEWLEGEMDSIDSVEKALGLGLAFGSPEREAVIKALDAEIEAAVQAGVALAKEGK